MIWVVADTNVLASGLAAYHAEASPAALILDAWRYGSLELVASAPILAELRRTLAKPYFARRFTTREIERALYLVRQQSNFVRVLADVDGVATTPDDDLILATAVTRQGTLSDHRRPPATQPGPIPGRQDSRTAGLHGLAGRERGRLTGWPAPPL